MKASKLASFLFSLEQRSLCYVLEEAVLVFVSSTDGVVLLSAEQHPAYPSSASNLSDNLL
jgi:hypothetical protein